MLSVPYMAISLGWASKPELAMMVPYSGSLNSSFGVVFLFFLFSDIN